jgi:outer membrane protein assembly factor BamB
MTARWLFLGLAFGLGCLTAGADDWPQWRGPGRDNRVTGFTPPQAWPKELKQKWRVPVGQGVASPALVGNKVYTFTRQGNEEVIACLEAGTGKEVWTDKYAAKAVTGAASSHPGARSSPAVADGKVCTLGVGGVLSCLDAGSGKVVWRKDTKTNPRFFTSFSPLIVDGLCIAHLGTESSGELGAYDLTTGDAKWKWTGDGPGYSSPVLMTVGGTRIVVAMTDKNVVGVGLADGKELWKVAFKDKYNSVTPIIDGQTVIYAGSGVGTTAIHVDKDGDKFTTKELWKVKQGPHTYNTPVLKDGLLYGLTPSRYFYCMSAKNGEVLWTDTTARGECGSVLDAGSVLLALTSDTFLVAFKPGDKGYEELARIKVAETPTWSIPIIAGNRVFVKDRDSLTLLTFE